MTTDTLEHLSDALADRVRRRPNSSSPFASAAVAAVVSSGAQMSW